MKKFFLLLIAVFLFACKSPENHPEPVMAEESTGDYELVFLFEVDGARVYRFYDKGHYRYLAVGQNGGNVINTVSESRYDSALKTTRTSYHDDSVIVVGSR